jgi:DNA invertase Pin-like site-specific DNA recombinase
MRRLDRGDATCLVTTRVERLSSSAEEWILLLELLEDLDVRLIVVEDALDTGASGGREEAWALVGRDAPLAPGQS